MAQADACANNGENHYYPFGLGMEGISDKAIKTNYAENKYRYNSGTELQNKEFSDGTGLQMYETGYRMLDPQLGRFSQVDPLSDQGSSESPYAFVGNNPVSFADPTGLKVAPKGGFSHYSPADQYYLNCLADPMHHVYPGDGDFMDGSSGGDLGSSFLMNIFDEVSPNGFDFLDDFTAKPGNSNGEQGTWISYTYSLNDGVYGGFGNETKLNTLVFGLGFVKDGSSTKGSEGDNSDQENGLGKFNNVNGSTGIFLGAVEAFSNSAKIAEIAHNLGLVGALSGFGVDLYGYSNYQRYGPNDKEHFIVSPEELGVNTIVTVYGISTGPPGWAVSSIYYTIDATIGWENAIPSYIEVEQNKQIMRDDGIMTYSDFKN